MTAPDPMPEPADAGGDWFLDPVAVGRQVDLNHHKIMANRVAVLRNEQKSRERARRGFNRSRLLAVIVLVALLALLLVTWQLRQTQQHIQEVARAQQAALAEQCAQRKVNAALTNQRLDGLAALDQEDSSLPDAIRAGRARLYIQTRQITPTC